MRLALFWLAYCLCWVGALFLFLYLVLLCRRHHEIVHGPRAPRLPVPDSVKEMAEDWGLSWVFDYDEMKRAA